MVFVIERNLVGIDGLVQLPHGGIDSQAAKHALHAERPRLIGDNRNDEAPEGLVARENLQNPHGGHRGRDLALARAAKQRFEGIEARNLQGSRLRFALGQVSAEGCATLLHVLDFRAVVRRFEERRRLQVLLRHRDAEPFTKLLERLQSHLVLLVGDVLPFARHAHPIALDGLGQDDRRAALVCNGLGVGGVHLVGVVSPAIQAPDILVAHIGHHLEQLGILPKEMLPGVGAAAGLVDLVVPVHGFLHPLTENAGLVLRDQWIPVGSPDQLDDIPASAAKDRFEFLDDLSVPANRTVESLEIAVHDEDQVVELLAPGQRNGSERLRFIHLPIAHEGPDFSAAGVANLAIVQVAHEARLVDRRDRPQAHRNRRELPEIRHQPRVGVGRQPVPVDFLAEAVEFVFADAPLEIGPRVDPRCRMALDVDQVAPVVLAGGMKEMVKADVVERGRRSKTRDVATEGRIDMVGLDDHRHRVPADHRPDAMLQLVIAGALLFSALWDRIQVRGVGAVGEIGALAAGAPNHPSHEIVGSLDSLVFENRVESVQPLLGFLRIGIGR